MQLYDATKSITFFATEMDTILMTLKSKNEPKPTLQGVAIAILYYGLLSIKVQMAMVKDINITTVESQKYSSMKVN